MVTRYDDVSRLVRDPTRFSSARGMGAMLRGEGSLARGRRPPEFGIDLAQLRVLIATDPPDHTMLRRLVGRAFTPREIAAPEPRIHDLADQMGR